VTGAPGPADVPGVVVVWPGAVLIRPTGGAGDGGGGVTPGRINALDGRSDWIGHLAHRHCLA